MTFEQWDIALARFPFVDLPHSKPRPVAVLSGRSFNRSHDLIVACMITTASAGPWPSDHAISDLSSTGLRHPCVVRWKVATLSTALVNRRLGHLGSVDQQVLRRRLANILPSEK